uniref:Uncharacterized protein n=1 Tax=Pyxicephalus adspersus TaxID=30357 RepID=A0AAV3AI06_PYXAD|nr:TPA: hypothetical protein GDO54_010506 [Pyxicephalus adspersus]
MQCLKSPFCACPTSLFFFPIKKQKAGRGKKAGSALSTPTLSPLLGKKHGLQLEIVMKKLDRSVQSTYTFLMLLKLPQIPDEPARKYLPVMV